MHKNLKAFLDTIAISELGSDLIALSDNGYNVMVGSTKAHPILFSPYDNHPHKIMRITNSKGVVIADSSAAGRYQILGRYYDVYKKTLNLPDFGHDSQDKIALQMISECKATPDIIAGHIQDAIVKCKSRWASFPGANYINQHMNDLEYLLNMYDKAGGDRI